MTILVKSNLLQRIKILYFFFTTELKAFYDLDKEVLDGYSHNSLDNRELRLDREILQRDGLKE